MKEPILGKATEQGFAPANDDEIERESVRSHVGLRSGGIPGFWAAIVKKP